MKFCLELSNHDTFFRNELHECFVKKKFLDVSLICDEKIIQAHKLVLSAFSPFFQTILLNNPCEHPTVIISNIKYDHLEAIIHFMYSGKITTSTKDDLEVIFNAAKCLKVQTFGERSDYLSNESECQPSYESEDQCNDVSDNQFFHKFENQSHEIESVPTELPSDMELNVHSSSTSTMAKNSFENSVDFQLVEESVVSNIDFEDSAPNILKPVSTENDPPTDESSHQSTIQSETEQPQKVSNHSSNSIKVPTISPTLDDMKDATPLMPKSQQLDCSQDSPSKKTQKKKRVKEKAALHSPKLPKWETKDSLLSDKSSHQSPIQLQTEQPQNVLDNSSNSIDIPFISPSFAVQNDVMPKSEQLDYSQDISQKKPKRKKKVKKIAVLHLSELQKLETKDTRDISRKVLNEIGNNEGLVKKFKCKYINCDFKSSYRESLKRHNIAKHVKTRQHRCDMCDYAATLKQHLVRHKADVHEKNKPKYRCTMCPYECAQSCNLKRHIQIRHEGIKPYKCDECDFITTQKANIQKHKTAIHEQRRDFTCDFCTYRCSAKQNLKRHVILRHSSRNLKT